MTQTYVTLNGKTCPINQYLLRKLDNIKAIIKKNWDCCIVIDGMERSGKSTLGLTIGWYLTEGKLTYNNLASNSDEAFEKCMKLPDRSVLMLDEGSLIFNSKDTMKKEQRQLLKVMNVIGQKNMVFIIIMPLFFDLAKAIAVNRSRFLLHVYTDKKLNRGRFSYFSEKKKKILYDYGKKHFNSYTFPHANWTGLFYDFMPFDNPQEYLEIKKRSLASAFSGDDKKGVTYVTDTDRRYAINILNKYMNYKKVKITRAEIAGLMNISVDQMRRLKDKNKIEELSGEGAELLN